MWDYCKSCHYIRNNQWNAKNPEKRRFIMLKHKYKLSAEDYAALIASQGYACKMCGTRAEDLERPLVVDHDHKCCSGEKTCGKCVRGLICQGCNKALGLYEDPVLMRLAGEYLGETS